MRTYPEVQPRTMRDAYMVATALGDVADEMEARYPLTARTLRARAQRAVEQARAQAALTTEQTDARGRWASRSSRCGPRVQPGPAHIVIVARRVATTDLNIPVLCGANLTGREITFAGQAEHPTDCPPAWKPCRDCRRILTGDIPDDPHAAVFDEQLDQPAKAMA